MIFFKILIGIIAGCFAAAVVALLTILFSFIGIKFIDWLSEKFKL